MDNQNLSNMAKYDNPRKNINIGLRILRMICLFGQTFQIIVYLIGHFLNNLFDYFDKFLIVIFVIFITVSPLL